MTASLAMRPKGPQPVDDSLEEPDSEESAPETQPEDGARSRTAPRLEHATNGFALHRSSTQIFHDDAGRRPSRNASPAHLAPRPGLLRAKSDFGPRREEVGKADDGSKTSDSGEWGIRHGFENQLVSEEYNNLLNASFFLYFTDKKHETNGNPKYEKEAYPLQEWRMRDRLKTVSAVLALCLNIGVDPPDVIKTTPCAKLEAWVDPSSAGGVTAVSPINLIGKALQTQYEQLSMRTRYKLSLDPTVDETRRYTSTLRRNARNERVLFHYNGHGVPKPTSSGEIWVFNRTYTQYIPISLFDLQTWLGAPSLFVWDCTDAGLIIQNFKRFSDKHEAENDELRRRDPDAEVMDFRDCIHLAACREKENLPTNPDLPADVFTACLTTPIETAVRFFILQNPLPSGITLQDAANIPGRVSERRTPIGELNWIFTAITDTIAWNSLPKPLFKKLFRQDLMVAALFRNFLLAQRIMRVYHCHPQCYPEIPPTHDDPLWRSWDLAVEMILSQLPDLVAADRGEKQFEYQHSNFFAEQLTAFEVYLSQGAVEQKVPQQLPVVLQVLLSQVHRLRALILLSRFLDLGPWAVNLALGIGIFPYVLKLLQSQAIELKPVMVFIWARILAVDQTCQTDLLKDNGYQYFISILNPSLGETDPFLTLGQILTHTDTTSRLLKSYFSAFINQNSSRSPQPSHFAANPSHLGIPIGNASEHRAMCAFIVAMFCKDFHQGQVVCLSPELIESCLGHLSDADNPLLRQWICLCISMLWVNFPEAKWVGIRCSAHIRLCELIVDPVAEVRAAMLHAMTTFLGIPDLTPQVAQIEESIAAAVLAMGSDGNTMVRKELVVFFSTFIARYQSRFVVAAYEQLLEEQGKIVKAPFDDAPERAADLLNGNPKLRPGSASFDDSGVAANTIFASIWKQVLVLSVDPQPEVAQNAGIVVDCVFTALLQSPLAPLSHTIMDAIMSQQGNSLSSRSSFVEIPAAVQSQPTTPPTPTRPEGLLTATLKRTSSVAASLKEWMLTPAGSAETSPRSPNFTRLDGSRPPLNHRSRPENWDQPPDMKDHDKLASVKREAMKLPEPRIFRSRNVNGETPSIPLKSDFYAWSVEYFREPQMKPSEADEPGSEDYNQRLWRRNRNDRIIAKTQPLKEVAGTHPWDTAKAVWSNHTQPMKMCFHQFEDHLIVGDDRDGLSVWDWKKGALLSRFSNGNPLRSKITELKLINEDDQAFLMTGSSDGVVKLYRDYESQRDVELVTTFRALTDLEPSTKNAGLVFDWQQSRGLILVAGDVRSIRVWNAGTEICTNDINARSGSPITSLTSDQVEGNLFVAGFGDGALRLYDQREKSATAMVMVWKEHKAWITNVHLQRGGQRELISACRNGEVKLWDMRWDKSLRTTRATKDTLRTLSVHEHAPVFAVGTDRHVVKIFSTAPHTLAPSQVNTHPTFSTNTNINGTSRHGATTPRSLLAPPVTGANGSVSPHKGLLSTFEPYSGFMSGGSRTAIACTAFHPHRMMIAGAGMGDSHVNIFRCTSGKGAGMGEGKDD